MVNLIILVVIFIRSKLKKLSLIFFLHKNQYKISILLNFINIFTTKEIKRIKTQQKKRSKELKVIKIFLKKYVPLMLE